MPCELPLEGKVANNAFMGKLAKPSGAELDAALGASKVLWDQLVTALRSDTPALTPEWNSYSPKAGWSLRLKKRDRNIVYLSPQRRGFMASFALGPKAVALARAGPFPWRVIQIIDEAKRYAEGTVVRIQVKEAEDVGIVRRLTEIKLRN